MAPNGAEDVGVSSGMFLLLTCVRPVTVRIEWNDKMRQRMYSSESVEHVTDPYAEDWKEKVVSAEESCDAVLKWRDRCAFRGFAAMYTISTRLQ
jgi:hypothetical protein